MVRIAASRRKGMLAKDFWNSCAVPAVSPWTEMGTLILAMVFWMAPNAWLMDMPGGNPNEKVVATKGPWGLTDKGVVPGPKLAKVDKGTIASTPVETEA